MKKLFSLLFLLFILPQISFAQSAKIIGGVAADEGEYPFAVALVSSGSANAFNGQFCGGSLISSQWVLTAAHCVSGSSPASIDLVLGRIDLRTTDGERIAAQQIIVHPDYNPSTFDSDIALIKLASASTQTPVSLPTQAVIDAVITGTTVTPIGWGTTQHSGGVSSNPSPVLLEVDLPVVSKADCNASYGIITDNMICAGLTAGGKDSCQGDSGGPLVADVGGEDFLMGATSFGNGCALANFPGVYTRVSKFLEFISGNTGIGSGGGGGGGGAGGGDGGSDSGSNNNLPDFDPPSCFPGNGSFPVLNPTGDSDLDGSSDTSEGANGTSSSDPGSLAPTLNSPTFALWTGFLDIIPIAELINGGSNTGAVRITLFNQDGTVASSENRAVPPGGQTDVIISDMAGFQANSHGLLKFDFCDMDFDGRMSYYKADGSGDYEFAYSIPFNAPLYGDSAVSFNTFQPSLNPDDAGNLVANWLSIVNLSSTAQAFTVEKYDSTGNLLSTQSLALAGGERRDVEAGHINPGPSNVGYIKIRPSNPLAAYQALIVRFGANDSFGAGTNGYSFAFPLIAKAGNGEDIFVPLTTTVNSQNWLEVVNTKSSTVTASIFFYQTSRSGGDLVDTQTVALAPNSQIHFNVNERIGNARLGYAKISPNSSNSIIAQSMVYTYNEETGGIVSMYGSQAREAIGDDLFGSYNLYLDMFNYLKLINVSGSDITVDLTINNGSSSNMSTVFIGANGSRDLPIHNGIRFGTSPNTLGAIKVEPSSSGSLIAELLRIRTETASDGEIDFIFPTSVRFTD